EADAFAALVQYPGAEGEVRDYAPLAARLHERGAFLVAAADLLALTLLKPPGEWGADVAVGNSQRFGVPMGYGGPHAAFMGPRASSASRGAPTASPPSCARGWRSSASRSPPATSSTRSRSGPVRRPRRSSRAAARRA